MTAVGSSRDPKIDQFISGMLIMVPFSLPYKGIRILVCSFRFLISSAQRHFTFWSPVISLDINPLEGMLATGSGDNTARICTYSVCHLVCVLPELIFHLCRVLHHHLNERRRPGPARPPSLCVKLIPFSLSFSSYSHEHL